jgi:deoxyhypusine synthase
MKIREFLKTNYKHFNSAVVVDAAEGWIAHLDKGGKMFITIAGAMSTAELGISLAEIIRKNKIHGICSTGANLEEDIFNLVANKHYKRVPNYRNLSDQQEAELRDKGLNRVTDTCIPEEEALRRIEHHLLKLWMKADQDGQRYFPYEYFYQLVKSGVLKDSYQIDPRHSWVMAACEKNLPIFTPGWEDSTMGNIFVSNVIKGNIKSFNIVKNGLEQMDKLIGWYLENSQDKPIGFFQIGGGIAGDFPICVVPLIQQDLQKPCKFWGYFCQISDSTTSYGSYSGAVPNEKITWGKLGIDTPRYIIESDASIVAPLIFNYILEE